MTMTTASEKKLTILSIEDDPDIASLIRLLIGRAPAELLSAHHPTEAREILADLTPDLILLDLMLPEINGLDFLEELRGEERFVKTPVLVVSVRTDAAHRQRARELGAFRYCVKPFSPASLRHDIQDALSVDWSEYWQEEHSASTTKYGPVIEFILLYSDELLSRLAVARCDATQC